MRYLLALLFLVSAAASSRPLNPPSDFRFGNGSLGAGWTLNESNVGLAPHGLDCDSLPVYSGPNPVPADTTITEVRFEAAEVLLYNGNITIERSCFRPTADSNRSSIVFAYNPDTMGGQLGSVTISDSDIDASARPAGLVYANCAVRGAFSLYRNNIKGMGSGICYFGADTVANDTWEHNYVHSLRAGMFGAPPQQSHNSSSTVRRGPSGSLTIRNNRLISRSGADSGAMFIQPSAGPIGNIQIEGNLFGTFGYNVVLENWGGNTYGLNNTSINNRFEAGGFGVGYVSGGDGWDVWDTNFIYDASDPDGRGAVAGCPGGACGAAP